MAKKTAPKNAASMIKALLDIDVEGRLKKGEKPNQAIMMIGKKTSIVVEVVANHHTKPLRGSGLKYAYTTPTKYDIKYRHYRTATATRDWLYSDYENELPQVLEAERIVAERIKDNKFVEKNLRAFAKKFKGFELDIVKDDDDFITGSCIFHAKSGYGVELLDGVERIIGGTSVYQKVHFGSVVRLNPKSKKADQFDFELKYDSILVDGHHATDAAYDKCIMFFMSFLIET